MADQNGVLPAASDTFDVVHTTSGVVGVSGENLPGAGGQVGAPEYNAQYSANDVTLTVVPLNTAPPTIISPRGAGTAYVGDTLTCSTGAWSYTPTGFSYLWYLNGYSFSSGPSYTVQTADLQTGNLPRELTCGVVATNAGGSSVQAMSASIEAVSPPAPPPPLQPPTATTLPTITGTDTEGDVLTESHATWSPAPTSYAYQWLRCNSAATDCQPITGATGHAYTLTPADTGSTIIVQEAASNAAGPGATTASRWTAIVTAAFVATPTVAPPNTSVASHRIQGRQHSAMFHFKTTGAATRLQCALVHKPARKGRKAPEPHNTACGPTKTYKHLTAGKYILYARASGPGGTDRTPATVAFTIPQPRRMRAIEFVATRS